MSERGALRRSMVTVLAHTAHKPGAPRQLLVDLLAHIADIAKDALAGTDDGGEAMDWVPTHKCGLYLEHNAHRDVYESVADYYDPDHWVSVDERDRGIENDEAWALQWYPDTPIGFHRVVASSLLALIEAIAKADRTPTDSQTNPAGSEEA